jgi:hypothetical protein
MARARSRDLSRSADNAVVLQDGRVLVAGGIEPRADDEATPMTVADAELYDPATGTFSATGPMGTPRVAAAAASLPDGGVLLAGGAETFTKIKRSWYTSPTTIGELFDPVTGTFSPTDPMARPRSGAVAVGLADGSVLVAGGEDIDPSFVTAEVYR